ncbi:phycobiliprotein lyase [Anthocerotibacter panamensis]|uniref:phycobiliprotein lyase n=1 Tax=Anthocerotibacter panamensis TaxID=2857077 RepID=UPI001C401721|nr:phycobiliprotein lyase [Anthocerotibacter panamensis]
MQDPKPFLEANVGRWLCQRSSYYLELGKDQGGKLEMTVQWLEPTDPIAQQLALDPTQTLGGLTLSWKGTLALETRPYLGTSTFLLAHPQTGAGLLYALHGQTTLQGHYRLEGEALTLILNQGEFASEERIWFGGPNLRLRALTVKRGGGWSMVSFFSEIRAQPPADN